MNRTDNFNIHSTNIWVDYELEYLKNKKEPHH